MDTQQAIDLLRQRLEELESLTPGRPDSAWTAWHERTLATVQRVLPSGHRAYNGITTAQWLPRVLSTGGDNSEAHRRAFERGRGTVRGILSAAIYELQELTQEAGPLDATSVDPELWGHVEQLVQQEDWSKVASQAAIFVEDRLRTWSASPATLVGRDLASAVLKPTTGTFPLGLTDAEQDGWHMLARGFMGALRNADGHRIQQRPDLKQYALGVLGTASLLLTQLRYEHGNRFRN